MHINCLQYFNKIEILKNFQQERLFLKIKSILVEENTIFYI